jgi:hypothetical protein
MAPAVIIEIGETIVLPTVAQRAWLVRGLDQPGGKLPLFDRNGQRVSPRTIKSCLEHGWATPWFANPLKPDWLVCKLTPAGRDALRGG